MKKLFLSFLMMLAMLPLAAANKYDNPDTLVVSRDGTANSAPSTKPSRYAAPSWTTPR